jgi:hypothetical protein
MWPILSRNPSMFWKQLDHPLHSLDLWPYDFHVFGLLTKALNSHEKKMVEKVQLCSDALAHAFCGKWILQSVCLCDAGLTVHGKYF